MYGTDLRLGTTTRGLEIAAPVTLSRDDRRRHILLVGKTGTGKSTTLKRILLSDLEAGAGVTLLDPHGDLADAAVDAIPPWRSEAIYFNPADLSHSIGLNILAKVPPDNRPLVAAHLVAAFAHIWGLSVETTPRLMRLLNAALRLLLDSPGTTLVQLPRAFSDITFREHLTRNCVDPIIRGFWTNEFAHYNERFALEVVDPLLNKIGLLLAEPAIRHIVGQHKSTIDVRRIMDESRILIANLSKGRLGEGPAHLLGALLVTAYSQAAEQRATIAENERVDHTLIIDEFQNFSTQSFATVLSESRKYRLALVLAHQHLHQYDESLRHAVFGNAGSLLVFRVGGEDAQYLGRELQVEPQSLMDLPNFAARAMLLRNGTPTNALYLQTELATPLHRGRADAVKARTRARHARERSIIETMIERQLDS